MSGYPKDCKFCGQIIKLSEDSGRWLPYNLDNTAHECKGKQPQTQTEQPNKSSSTLSLESIDARLKKIEHTLYGNQ